MYDIDNIKFDETQDIPVTITDSNGNALELKAVEEILNTTFSSLNAPASSEKTGNATVITKNFSGAVVAHGSDEKLETLNDFRPENGYGFVRCGRESTKLELGIDRPVTVFVMCGDGMVETAVVCFFRGLEG